MTEPARVKMEISFKANVGNFQNITITVGLEDSVSEKDLQRNPARGGVDACAERVYGWVSEQIEARLEETKEQIKEIL